MGRLEAGGLVCDEVALFLAIARHVAERVGVDLDLECVACLKRFRYPLEISDFAYQVELTGAESVDLTGVVREDILLALPPHPHCDWNGEKVCQGASLRANSEAAPEPLSETRDAWGALDQLKINKTN